MPSLRHPPAPPGPEPVRLPLRGEALPTVSVIVPVYNGAATVWALAEAVFDANPGYPLQLVLVNDGSSDGSDAACRRVAAHRPDLVTYVDLARNMGEHNAVMAGLAYAEGDYCVIMDDDFQNPPGEAFRLADEAIRSRRDIVFGAYPVKRHHWARNLCSRFVNACARRLMRLQDGLYLSSFKCLSRFAVDHVLAYRGPFPYVDGLALRATRNIGVLTTVHDPSRKPSSGYSVGKLFRLWGAMTVNFSVLPLRTATMLGLGVSLAGVAASWSVISEKLENPGLPVGWPSLIVAVMLLSGVQLLILGVIGEYLGQLVLTVNGTPQYVVRSVVGERKGRCGE